MCGSAEKPYAHLWRQVLLFVALVFVTHGAIAETLVGKVVRVADGDTLTILDAAKRQHKISLDAIDAPELGQAFGKRSRQSLADLCAGKAAQVDERGKDRYGRTIGRVTCARVDASSEQVRRGMAWVFDRYATANSPLYKLQWEAQGIKRGYGRIRGLARRRQYSHSPSCSRLFRIHPKIAAISPPSPPSNI